MLHSYEAIYDHGQMKWLGDCPLEEKAHVIVTVLPETLPSLTGVKRTPPRALRAKAKCWAISSHPLPLARIGIALNDRA